MSSEFDLIHRYFTQPTQHTRLGIGDDAALLACTADHELAVSTDMLVAGTHFFADTDPYHLGWKSLAVNLSDLAAMGATPRWATLALAMPSADEGWIKHFAGGLFACAEEFEVDLIGGDTTRGPLCISIQIMGELPAGMALKRSGAQVGDHIWVSGQLGDAALALNHLLLSYQLDSHELAELLPALLHPVPRVALGIALRSIAHSAIDISDGLLADLGHILEQSAVGAELHLASIPCSDILHNHLHQATVQQMLLAGGEDYELCFTAPSAAAPQLQRLAQDLQLQLSCIGSITSAGGLTVKDPQGHIINLEQSGFDHFK